MSVVSFVLPVAVAHDDDRPSAKYAWSNYSFESATPDRRGGASNLVRVQSSSQAQPEPNTMPPATLSSTTARPKRIEVASPASTAWMDNTSVVPGSKTTPSGGRKKRKRLHKRVDVGDVDSAAGPNDSGATPSSSLRRESSLDFTVDVASPAAMATEPDDVIFDGVSIHSGSVFGEDDVIAPRQDLTPGQLQLDSDDELPSVEV